MTRKKKEPAAVVVGVGASAGGLDAFSELLAALPIDTGMAFVLVQHLAATRESALAAILGRATKMPVSEIVDDMAIEPNHVYVIPPDRSLVVSGGALRLLPRPAEGIHRPINQFFLSLAAERGTLAIGVVLSGMATDGTLGLEAIKAEGGITFAQDGTAQHDGMPHSAIASGLVDFVLRPADIARELERIALHPRAGSPAASDAASLSLILHLLHLASGVDFTLYKSSTIHRRIGRRMLLRKTETLVEYARLLKQTPAEIDNLYQDILINVTRFFRDPEAFAELQQTVFPRLLADRSRHDPIRVWTLGCSTGQEAYSLVMAFTEVAEAAGSAVPIQVFATDLNPVGIATARAGIYPSEIAEDVSPERLRRFFTEVDGQYRVAKAVRDACVFSRHDVAADPPFSRIDLVSCRNLLIYLEPALQQRIVPLLHYALKSGGCIWLGGSETLGTHRDLFDVQDVEHRIYVKKAGSSSRPGTFSLLRTRATSASLVPLPLPNRPAELQQEADRVVLARYTPAGVLVTPDLEILQYRGDTGPFLSPVPGKASLNLLKMLREGLTVAVRGAVRRAEAEGAAVRVEGLRVRSDEGFRTLDVEVLPVRGTAPDDGGFLILFEPTGSRQPLAVTVAPEVDTDTERLATELTETRAFLQAIVESQEAANEQLQSANEEIQSSNEELQSINEELETSKEEIQSSNEELSTVNDELNSRNHELTQLHTDEINLIGSMQMAIVMVGPDLRIRRFTPMAQTLLKLIATDVGRPLADIRMEIDGLEGIEALLTTVMDTVTVQEREVRARDGHRYMLRMRPYRTLDRRVDGVVLVLVDIDDIRQAEAAAAHLAAIVTSSDDAIYSIDLAGLVKSWNESAERLFGYTAAEIVGTPSSRMDPAELNEEPALLARLARGERVERYETVRLRKDGSRLDVSVVVSPVRDHTGAVRGAATLARDISGRKRAEAELVERDRRARDLIDALPVAVYTTDAQRKITHFNPAAEAFAGTRPWKLSRPDGSALPNHDGIVQGELLVAHRPDGARRWVELHAQPLRDADGTTIGGIEMILDVTARREAEAALQISETRYRRLFETAKDGILILDAETGRITDANPFVGELTGKPAHELLGKELWELGLFEDIEASKAAVRELQEKRYLRYDDLPLATRDGAAVAVELVSNVYDEGDRQVIQCNIREITERKHALQALSEANARFEALFDASPIGMYLVDDAFQVRLLSQQVRAVFGEVGEPVGMDFGVLLHKLWPQAVADDLVAKFRHTLATGEPYRNSEFSEMRYDREVREQYDWEIQRIALPDGKFGVVCYFSDVSERLKLTDALRRTAADLAESDRRKDEFLAMLAHELRDPIAPMANAVQVLRRSERDPERVQSASAVLERQLGQLEGLVADLLDVSRISHGRIELRRAQVDFSTIVRQAVASSAPAAADATEVLVDLPLEPLYVYGDATRLTQVVLNLLNNARKFTDTTGRIEVTLVLDPRAGVVLRVADTGIGISPEDLTRIFDMFVQVDTSLARPAGGLGIGLTLVRQLVEKHGGTVTARSAGLGLGSEFVVTLPALQGSQTTETPPAPMRPATARRILVVDDNRDSAMTLAELFALDGHVTRASFDGVEALEAFEAFAPDVVLLDLGLVKRDGYQVARAIRDRGQENRVALIALTGWGQREDRERSRAAGFDAHLVKPLRIDTFYGLLADIFPA